MVDTKENKVRRIEETVLSILAYEGEDKLTISHLAKQAKVTRPWIYKQFGASVDDMLFFSAKVVSSHFAMGVGAHPMRTPQECWNVFYLAAEQSLRDLDSWPWVPTIYFEYVKRPGPIGEAIRESERLYIAHVSGVFREVFALDSDRAQDIALSFIKVWAATAHTWIHDERLKKSGPKAAIEMILLPFSQAGYVAQA